MNVDIEASLDELPDLVADALLHWRKLELSREKIDALLHMDFKASEEKRTADDIKALVRASDKHYQAKLLEITAEANYTRLHERLLALKKRADLRTAF